MTIYKLEDGDIIFDDQYYPEMESMISKTYHCNESITEEEEEIMKELMQEGIYEYL